MQARNGSRGSPYAIRDYRAVDPALGNQADFIKLTDAAHRYGLGVIIDLVYNHVSPDSVIAASHPEWLWRDANGNPGLQIADWRDVAP